MKTTVQINVTATAPDPSLPAWVPPPGTFARIPQANTLRSQYPALYGPASGSSNPLVAPKSWSSAVYLPDWGNLGAVCYFGEDHWLVAPLYMSSNIFSFDDMTWRCNNTSDTPHWWPSSPNHDPVRDTPDESHIYPDGTWNPGHTYRGLCAFTRAQGSEKLYGEVLCFAPNQDGVSYGPLLGADPSQEFFGKYVVVPNVNTAAGAGISHMYRYAQTVVDTKRNGVWLGHYAYGTGSPTYFYDFTTKQVTYKGTNIVGSNFWESSVYWPTHDIIVALRDYHPTKPDSNNTYQKIKCIDCATSQVFYRWLDVDPQVLTILQNTKLYKATSGDYAMVRMGGEYSTLMDKVVGFVREGTRAGEGLPWLFKIEAPADPRHPDARFTVTAEQLTSHDGSAIDVATTSAETMNLLREVPKLKAFFLAESDLLAPQLLRSGEMI